MPSAEFATLIRAQVAPGIEIQSVIDVSLDEPALQAMTRETSFVATITDDEGIDHQQFRQQVADILTADEVLRKRTGKKKKVKQYDLRPLILGLAVNETADYALQLVMHLKLEPGKTGRPDEVLKELGLDPLEVRIERLSITLANGTESFQYGSRPSSL